jgi:excisionase family DNA binding protein
MLRYDPLDKLLKIKDVAEILNIHPSTIRRWSEQGKIEAYRIGNRGDRRFRQSAVDRFITGFNPFKQDQP